MNWVAIEQAAQRERQIIAARHRGMRPARIAAMLGVRPELVYRVLMRAGLWERRGMPRWVRARS